MDTSTVPQITEGSVFEIGGALFQAAAAQSISTTDPHTSSTVADGTVYIFINGTDGEPYFTATAPTWDDDKQGWYGTSTYANYRYVPILMTKSGSSYSSKKRFNYLPGFDGVYMDADGNITVDGDISIGTDLAVGGDILGNIDDLFEEITTVSGTTDSGDTETAISYPSGFTFANTMIMGGYVANSGGTGKYFIGYYGNVWSDSFKVYASSSNIYLYVPDPSFYSCAYKLLICNV